MDKMTIGQGRFDAHLGPASFPDNVEAKCVIGPLRLTLEIEAERRN